MDRLILIYAYVIVIFLRPQDWISILYGLPVGYILIPVGIALGLMKNGKDWTYFKMPQIKFTVIYILLTIVSCLLTYSGSGSLITYLTMWLQRLLLFLMIVLLINNDSDLEKVVWVFISVLALLSIQGIQQGLTGTGWAGVTPDPRYSEIRVRWLGDWDGPNVYGLILASGALMSSEVLFSYKEKNIKLLGAVYAFFLLVAVYFTNSRGAVLGIFFGFAFQLLLKNIKNWKKFLKGASLFLVIAIVLVQILPSRMTQLSSSESSAHERTWMWEQGLRMLRENPVFGIGKGMFERKTGLRAHNNYVQVFSETGLIGFFFWMGIIWFSFKGLFVNEFKKINDKLQRMMKILLSGFATYCGTTFFVTMENDSLIFFLGLIGAAYKINYQKRRLRETTKINIFDVGIIMSLMAIILIIVWLVSITEII